MKGLSLFLFGLFFFGFSQIVLAQERERIICNDSIIELKVLKIEKIKRNNYTVDLISTKDSVKVRFLTMKQYYPNSSFVHLKEGERYEFLLQVSSWFRNLGNEVTTSVKVAGKVVWESGSDYLFCEADNLVALYWFPLCMNKGVPCSEE